jgi:excisionase family DNA binding protein
MNLKEFSVVAYLADEERDKIAQAVAAILSPIIREIQTAPAPAPSTEEEEPISKKEACKYFGCSEPTMTKYMAQGLVPFHRKSRRVYFFKSELRQALEQPKRRRA